MISVTAFANNLKAPIMLVLFSVIPFGQSFSQIINGIIRDTESSRLPGVTVQVKHSHIATVTDSNGAFSIAAKKGDELIFSSIGAITKSVIVGSSSFIEVSLPQNISNLNEVIMIGYGTTSKKDLTGAVSSVAAKNFNKGIFASPDQLIQGKVAGLQISSNNGQPGGATTVKIRGNAALSGTGQPLYVIDGVPLDGRTLQAGVTQVLDGSAVQTGFSPLNFINPDDIASIDVLKDASATAIYGSRAAYGVVMISTKQAKAGDAKLSVSSSVGVTSVLKKIKILNASQFRAAVKYYGLNSSLDKGGDEDAMDAILRRAFQQNYSIGITGGNETGKYRLSSNFLNQDGIIKNTGFKKYVVYLVTNFKFLSNKKLGVDISVNGSQSIQNVPVPEYGAGTLIVPALSWNPTLSLKNADGSPYLGTVDNPSPVAIINLLKNNFKTTTILANMVASYKFTGWLEYKLLTSINYSTGITRSSTNQNYPGQNGTGSASINNSELTTSQFTNTLNFDKKILPGLNLEAVAGFESTEFTMKGSSLTGRGVNGIGFGDYGLDYTNYVQYSSAGNRSITSFIDPVTRLTSFFGRAIFNYKDQYLLTGTFRADGSTKFGNNNKYGYFPSFAAAWNISKENFFKVGFINSLKVRVGWGRTGNQEFPSGASQAKYSFFDNGVIRQVNIPNPDLKWQSDRQYNIGIDFSIFNNRVSGTVDYFNKSSTNLLFPGPPIQSAPPTSVVRWVNLDGNIINKGLEILLNGSIVSNDRFNWNLSVNATFLKNMVTNIPFPVYTGDVGGSVQIIWNGLPMQTFYTRKFLGMDKSNGFSIYQDDGATYYDVGDPNPKTLLGITSAFRFKKFTLTANMYGALGQDVYNATEMFILNVSNIQHGGNISLLTFKNPVKESFDNPLLPSSRYIKSGSYFKMANLTFSYNAGEVLKTFKAMNIFITGQNLFLITRYDGFDPETNSLTGVNGSNNTNVPSLGIDYPHYPSARTFIIGLSFSL